MNTLCPDAGASVDPNMPPPSDMQVQHLSLQSSVTIDYMNIFLKGTMFTADSASWSR